MSSDPTTPVVICGAGPAGLAAAAELAWHGVPCVVVEPRTEVDYDRPRAKTTSARTMEHLRRWGLADHVRARAPLSPSWSRSVTFCTSMTDPPLARFDDVFGLVARPVADRAEGGQQVPQPVLEEILREHLEQSPMVRLLWGSTVREVVEQEELVRLSVVDSEGVGTEMTCRYLLGCDGARSIVRDAIGARLVGSSEARSNLNVVFRAPSLTPTSVQYWLPGLPVPVVMGPLDLEGLWWAGFLGVDRASEGEIRELLRPAVGGDVAASVEVISTDVWTPRMLVADTFQSGRVLLVGESAHLNPPFGGHGFNTCVGDAVNASWKVAAVLAGWGGPHLLSSYDPERRAVVEQTLASAVRNMRASTEAAGQDPAAWLETKREEFHSLGLVLGYSYAGSPVVEARDDAGEPRGSVEHYMPLTDPGSRLPHLWLEDGTSLYDRLGRGFTLLGPIERDPDGVQALAEQAQALIVPLAVLRCPPGHPGAEEFLLVRPDQHVAWRSDSVGGLDLVTATGHAPHRPARG